MSIQISEVYCHGLHYFINLNEVKVHKNNMKMPAEKKGGLKVV